MEWGGVGGGGGGGGGGAKVGGQGILDYRLSFS